MREESIQVFLKIIEAGTISGAAEALFTTQSNISKQVRQLEKEVGVKLLYRHRGKRHIELTPYGEEFLHVARKWEALQQEFSDIPNKDIRTEISIGAVDLINTFTFKEFYKEFMKKHPQIRLDIHTHHSKEIYAMLEAHKIDIGYAGIIQSFPDLSSKPLCRESMAVLNTFNSPSDIMKPEDLNPDHEIYAKWSDDFEIWHDNLWPGHHYQIHCGTGSMVANYLEENRWAIVPASLARQLPFNRCQLTVDLPEKVYYQIKQKNIRENRISAIKTFESELYEFLKKDQDLTLYK